MIIHDLIKIKYSREGYLPNYPYHLTSDREMIEAFTKEGGYFDINYPCVVPELSQEYDELKSYIFNHLKEYVDGKHSQIHSWVYSYMIGEVISVNSRSEDILMLYNYFNMAVADNTDMSFNPTVSSNCFSVSDVYVKKLTTNNYRPPCMFGEPHVIKCLRLKQVTIV